MLHFEKSEKNTIWKIKDMKLIRMLQLLATGLSLSVWMAGCTASMYPAIGESYKKGTGSLSKTVNSSFENNVRGRRLAAAVYFINNGFASNNLVSDAKVSVARFACVGALEYELERNSLKALNDYGNAISDITKKTKGGLVAKWSDIQRIRESGKIVISVGATDPAVHQQCLNLALDSVPPEGEPIIGPPIAEVAVVPVISAIVALNKLLNTLGELATDAQRAEAMRKLITDRGNRDVLSQILDTNLTDAKVQAALLLRKKRSLIVPYYQIKKLLNLNRADQKTEIMELALHTHNNLSDFDKIWRLAPPMNIAASVRTAHTNLLNLANGQLTAPQAWDALAAFAASWNALAEAFGKAEDAL